MDVNVAGERIRILRFAAAQPDDSRHNRIATRRVYRNNFTGAAAIFEDCASSRAVPNLVGNLQLTEWRAITSSPIAEAKF